MNPKFIQIATTEHNDLYALDSEGEVWRLRNFRGVNAWWRVTALRDETTAWEDRSNDKPTRA